MQKQLIKTCFLLLAYLTLLPQCSFDPKLEDLKVRVTVQDSEELDTETGLRIANLTYWHCCRFYFQYKNGQESPQQNDTQYPVQKPNGKGEVTFTLPEALLTNRIIQFNLNCAHKNDPNILYTDTVSNCSSLNSENNICNGQFLSGAPGQISVEVPSGAQLPASCVVK